MKTTIKTTWEIATYDVWGNAQDGYDVNYVYRGGEIEFTLETQTANAGMPGEFQHASPKDKQIREAFGIGKTRIETDGDDLTIYVNRSRDGYPIGALRCIPHASLSPIREK